MISMQQTERMRRRLRIVRVVACIDLVLLLVLVSSALTGQKGLVHVLGPLHGINYLLLLVVVGTGAIDGIWGWWFPVAVLLTAGPPGAFVGEWILHRRMHEQRFLTTDTSIYEANSFMERENTEGKATSLSIAREHTDDVRKERR